MDVELTLEQKKNKAKYEEMMAIEVDVSKVSYDKAEFEQAMAEARAHKCKEAFCLMEYANDITRETLWNSRNGVSPFCIHMKGHRWSSPGPDSDFLLNHVNWQDDKRVEFYVPPVGMRVFVDAFKTPEDAIAHFMRKYLWYQREGTHNQGPELPPELPAFELIHMMTQPNVVTVDRELQLEFEKRLETV